MIMEYPSQCQLIHPVLPILLLLGYASHVNQIILNQIPSCKAIAHDIIVTGLERDYDLAAIDCYIQLIALANN